MTGSLNRITPTIVSRLIQSKSIETLSGDQFLTYLREDQGLNVFKPEDFGQVDPRNEGRVLFSPSRAVRPNADSQKKSISGCPICAGSTTRIIDFTELSDGFSFINKNLYPAFYPHPVFHALPQEKNGFPAWGVHLLQWTSSYHDQDWHNMSIEDLVIVMGRLGVVERYLLTVLPEIFGRHQLGTEEISGHVSIIKNGGRGAGGSLAHGHQQIVYSNFLPRRIIEDRNFERNHGLPFSKYMLEENPGALLIKDLGEAELLVPFFMRRPYDMQLILKDTEKEYIHQLTKKELAAISRGWKIAISAIYNLMVPHFGEVSFNIITHNGSGAGLYFEILPKTQTEGGFELMGMSVCQSTPEIAAEQIRAKID